MESDQLPLEENLNPSDQGESPEAIAPSANLDNSQNENINENISEQSVNIDSEIDEVTSEITSENLAIIADISEGDVVTTAIAQLKQQEAELRDEVDQLKTTKSKILQDQIDDLQSGIIRLAQADVARLEYQKQELQSAIAILEKKKIALTKK